MSRGSTASNLSDHGPTRTSAIRRNANRKGPKKIQFTIELESLVGMRTEQLFLHDNEDVALLEQVIATQFNVPVANQFIYDWPIDEPTNKSLTFKELGLPPQVELKLAVVKTDIETPNEKSKGSKAKGNNKVHVQEQQSSSSASANASRQNDSVPSPSIVRTGTYSNATFDFAIDDKKNDVLYQDIGFSRDQTVKDVKLTFADITCIPFKQQLWHGWPKGTRDDMVLKDVHLDTPVHSLVLNEIASSSTSVSVPSPPPAPDENIDDDASTASPYSESLLVAEIDIPSPIPSPLTINAGSASPSSKGEYSVANANPAPAPPAEVPPRRAVAKKSTSKGALNALLQKRPKQCSSPTSIEADFTSQSHQPVSSIPTSSQPSALASAQEGNRRDSSCEPSTSKRFRLSDSPSQTTASDSLSSRSKRSRTGTTSPLLTLPKGLVKELLKYLDPLAELSLRRTCKTTNKWVTEEDYSNSRSEKWKSFSLKITQPELADGKNFETAVKLNLPITHYIFDVQEESFYFLRDRQVFEDFANFLSLRVKKLVLRKFFMFQQVHELFLINSFLNLEELTLDELVTPTGEGANSELACCPASLRNLKVLKLNYTIDIPAQNVLTRPRSWLLTWGMLADCHSLLYFRFPVLNENLPNPIESGEGIFAPLLEYIERKEKLTGVALEYLDFKNFNNIDSLYIHRFVTLLGRCHRRDIKLKNVNALLIQEVFDEEYGVDDVRFKFCENIVSLVNYGSFVENAPMRNVEKFKIDVYPSVQKFSSIEKAYKDIFWPKLNTIKIIDTKGMSPSRSRKNDAWSKWQLLQEDLYGLNGVFHRGSVQRIVIDSPKVALFLGEGRLAQKFVNLKILHISAWFADDSPVVLNRRLKPIWTKLKLEELTIQKCPRLNDNSFCGNLQDDDIEEDSDSDTDASSTPAFLMLRQSLKKMTLDLDGVRHVTDHSFKNVFSKMKFQTFILRASQPINVSEGALLKMLNGSFGRYIQRFPFDTWTSSKIDQGRFQRIGTKFRSLR